jgi:Ca-activated chloride channel homolog
MQSRLSLSFILLLFAYFPCYGQGIITARPETSAGPESPKPLPVSAIKIKAGIDGQLATVRVEHLFRNDTDQVLEGTYYFPVPEGATLLEFAIYDGQERRTGRVKEKQEARAAYSAASAQGEDPAILEMTRAGWFQSHIYPIPPRSEKRVDIIYSQILPNKEGVITLDYPLGRGYKKLRVPVQSVEIEIDLRSAVAIKNVFSPTHPLDLHLDGDCHATARLTTAGGGDAENFKLVYSLADEDIGLSLLTHRKEGEDGYFLLMLSPKVDFDRKKISSKDVVFVIDISMSMEGDKIRQAKEALRFGLTRTLAAGDRFNIVAFGGEITPMEKRLIKATPRDIARALEFVESLSLISATNINDALVAGMKMFEGGARPQNLVFITDGQPTASITDPNQIVANVRAANTAGARLFTFGVGADVNRLLLERLATENHGAEQSIADSGQLGREVSTFFARVSQPVLANLAVDFDHLQVDRVHPRELPDLYTKSQIKIFGRYKNAEDLRDAVISLTGQMNEQQQRFDFNHLSFPLVSVEKDFLPKLWATERAGALLAEMRLYGERPDLKQEVIELARQFNLVTPYTSMYVPTTSELEREKREQGDQQDSKKVSPSDSDNDNDEPKKNSQTALTQPAPAPPSSGVGSGNGTGMGSGSGYTSIGARKIQNQAGNSPAQNQLSQLPLSGRSFDRLALLAQSGPGTVVDPTGAVIPNATVTLKDQNTGASRTVTTDAEGNYSVAGLPPGNYRVEVTAPGFSKTEIENVSIKAGQTAATPVQLSPGSASEAVTVTAVGAERIENPSVKPDQTDAAPVQLSPAVVAEKVTVTAVAPAVDPTSSHSTSNYESRKIKELPSLAPVDSLARLAPGATSRDLDGQQKQPGSPDKPSEFRLWFNGVRPPAGSFSFNGQDNNDIDGRPVISINNFDSVDTLTILTTRGSGDASFTGASSINLITRAGTNEFHGTIFDYHLNRRLGALSPLERRSGLQRAPLFKNTLYGGTLGGPVRRDRAFFFGSFQGETEASLRFIDSTASLLTPTRRGLEELSRAFSDSRTVEDLIRRGPLANQFGNPQVTRTRFIPVLGVPVEFGEITRLIPSSAEGYEAGGRMNFNLTRRDTLDATYWHDSRSEQNAVGRLEAGYAGETGARSQIGGLRWNRLLSPRSSNELSFGINHARLALGLPGGADQTSGPSVAVGLRGLAYGQSPFLPSSHSSTLFDASDVLSHVIARHNLKLGAQLRRRLTGFDYLPGAGGQYYYGSFEDFVQGRATALAVAAGEPRSEFEETHQHYFIDDAWRVRSNLTLSFGMSYENATQPLNGLADRVRRRESNPSTALFDSSLGLEARAIPEVRRDNNNIAPRFGFAYSPRFFVFGKNLFGYDKTVIRGGISLSYHQTAYRPLAEIASSAPARLFGVLTPAGGVVFDPPAVPAAADLRSIFGGDPAQAARTELSRDYRTPFSAVWHLTASRDLSERLVVEAGYVGSRSIGLVRAIDARPVLFETGTNRGGPLRIYESSGRSIYNSMQLRADYRLTDQISAGIAYTFSKLIDDVPEGGGQIIGGIGDPATFTGPALQTFAQNPFDSSRGERALSSLDRRHLVSGHFVYTLPVHRDQSGAWGRLLGGWQASGIITAASGSPYTPLQYLGYSPGSSAIFAAAFSDRLGAVRPFAGNPVAPADVVAFSNAANSAFRFFLNPDGTPFISATGFIVADRSGFREGSVDQARFIYNDFAVEQLARSRGLAPDAFGATFAAGRPFGDVGRNTLLGPGLSNIDFALMKTTKLSEKVSLQFRAEFYNLFNHPNRARPNFTLENAGGFGAGDLGETDATPRRVRLALKLIF